MYVLDKSLANHLHDADIAIVLTPSCTILLLTEQPGSYSLFLLGYILIRAPHFENTPQALLLQPAQPRLPYVTQENLLSAAVFLP